MGAEGIGVVGGKASAIDEATHAAKPIHTAIQSSHSGEATFSLRDPARGLQMPVKLGKLEVGEVVAAGPHTSPRRASTGAFYVQSSSQPVTPRRSSYQTALKATTGFLASRKEGSPRRTAALPEIITPTQRLQTTPAPATRGPSEMLSRTFLFNGEPLSLAAAMESARPSSDYLEVLKSTLDISPSTRLVPICHRRQMPQTARAAHRDGVNSSCTSCTASSAASCAAPSVWREFAACSHVHEERSVSGRVHPRTRSPPLSARKCYRAARPSRCESNATLSQISSKMRESFSQEMASAKSVVGAPDLPDIFKVMDADCMEQWPFQNAAHRLRGLPGTR